MTAKDVLIKVNPTTIQRIIAYYNTQEASEILFERIKELLEEQKKICAESAKTKWDFGHKYIESAYVDKQSILNSKNATDE